MKKKEMVAMLLAGGQGKRLKGLTKSLAKPAVYFGGTYRIIDFPLSNCSNSGIDTVGVLTQYEPLVLHSYIGVGGDWDLNRKDGGVFVLPPHERENGSSWYRGTADAIYRNLKFVDQFDPEHVLILSGDHIYKMDYNAMLQYHKSRNADCTISVIDVSLEEASRFGILNTDEDLKIYEFEEKPAKPKSTLASMGVYIFKWEVLRKHLLEDGEKPDSSHDFGKDIIPLMLADGNSLYAYPFEGYWRDVGTVTSLWEANMDLLSDHPPLNLNDPNWRIFTRNPNQPAQYVAPEAKVSSCIINEGCIVHGEVKHSVLFYGVEVGEGSVITDSVIMPKVKIGKNVRIHKAIISENTVIEDYMEIGNDRENEDEILLIDNRSKKRKSVAAKTI
ncbi:MULTISPECIES: glucose-1-phosphate adenylyltransferase [unclassified Paenibacillus]|uniref:glucose-1-phosphate adenylyltransferase n=1 Tax=unclassified Paenibacillus TaxID=185978 RepID=UPI0024060DAF|nr:MULTISPECIES: glucose-1-phosphate adenylyltransferase [unclassified Paenibacillus]MDF9843342.1 glucose-1-phosphate adenylyltransferase [Paenibacillus sp. PastF-2]MDF9849930.1 glucose-1-phosphate adenylyltransferase [Paenibacillus sp. PastM-2]MDF9856638.1 glucose-1-phosphate adenylyltransferase [Paenibacillus sp. PastF-1]MDH6481907.1 glucose-1-phosphate adenylyltransferase [Paenibacillus sp. PastH-2]MDH6509333.1 glucose-1-phosphate adenylyltransferase [Paenibacillus sp. PastM-3]